MLSGHYTKMKRMLIIELSLYMEAFNNEIHRNTILGSFVTRNGKLCIK